MNEFLAAARHAVPFASHVGLMTSLNDHADRPGRGLADGEKFSTGRKMWQWIDTPHVPHGWDCGVLFDQTTGTLLCGDLITQAGAETVPVTESEILTASEAMRKPMDYYAHFTHCTLRYCLMCRMVAFPRISEVGGSPRGSPGPQNRALLDANPGFSGIFGIRV
jgi:hypothetical protein